MAQAATLEDLEKVTLLIPFVTTLFKVTFKTPKQLLQLENKVKQNSNGTLFTEKYYRIIRS